MVSDIIALFVDDTLKSTVAILVLVVAYKIYKLKCDSTSSCGRYFTFHGSNPGGADEILTSQTTHKKMYCFIK